MTFMGMLRSLKVGQVAKRDMWPSNLYFYLTPKTDQLTKQWRNRKRTWAFDAISEGDVKARDWVIVVNFSETKDQRDWVTIR